MHWLFHYSLGLLICFHSYVAVFAVPSGAGINDESYFEYVPDRLQWETALELCNQRSGALATVATPAENQELSNFLKSLSISQPVWISRKVVTHVTSSPQSLVLDFEGRSNRKHARLLQNFSSMDSVTICTHLQFDPKDFGFSAIFSYSTPSYLNEFQLRANLTRGKHVQLALLVHGVHGPYLKAFDHDDLWHSVCVSWSHNEGRWALHTDGVLIAKGEGLNATDSFGPGGLFIIGQEQDTYGGSFKADESFSGSITELHIWNRVLNSSEIAIMEKKCSPPSLGLVFKWSGAAMEIESSLRTLWRGSLCQDTFLHSLLHGPPSQNQTFAVQWFHGPKSEEDCGIFDPVQKTTDFAGCKSYREAVCQFKKDVLDVFSQPMTPFFMKLLRDANVNEDENINTSGTRELTLLQQLSQAALHTIEADGPQLLTPSDVLHLFQIDTTSLASSSSTDANATERMVSIATNYVKVASLMLEPNLATQWMGLTEEGVSVGPFTIVKSIDNLTETLADLLSAERRGFTLSTKNIDVYIMWQKLSQESCSQVFNPSTVTSDKLGSKGVDELVISETELRRIHSQGYEEVMFVHTHYSHLSDIEPGEMESTPSQQNRVERVLPGRLASAVISATIRDSSKAQNVPISVQYTLSPTHVVKYSQRVSPVCAFWNFSLMRTHTSSWSSDGCTVTFTGSSATSCHCNHTTNFAVLMNYLESKWTPEEELMLTKLTFIGSGASLCALMVTLMLFTVLDIPKSDRTAIHKNLFIALMCAQVILLCSGSAIHNKVACTLVAALLHLFFMAAFSWMLVEGLLLWSKVVAVNLNEDQHMKYYYLIGWGLPVLIVTITLASASGKYAADGYCWLSVQNGVIWGFAGPVIFIIMVNILVLTRVVVITISTTKRRSIMLAMGSGPVEQAYEQTRSAVKAVLVLLPILGLTWLCGVLVPFSIVLAYIFILLNSLQGLFIFLIYGVYNTEIRSTVNRLKERRKALHFSNCASSRPSSSVTNSRPASLPLGANASQEDEASVSTSGQGTETEKTRGPPCSSGLLKNCEMPTILVSKVPHQDTESWSSQRPVSPDGLRTTPNLVCAESAQCCSVRMFEMWPRNDESHF
ncbi:adhesion G-protein coupled receptor D2 isoform X2 [Gouania willdenowi]|uniref:adhesion G-protein coupled receptor D2 isoform X2 n=1 Tax=Gouania willdenowi TaxID=441366 RepID=UPI0010548341|nr:adhesion G-protein coupled receptor D2-like isoform X2 [Gouania willdenowi]